MAKLIRQKRQNKVSPIGVVKMTGLREMGNAMAQVGQFADDVRVQATNAFDQMKQNEVNDQLDYITSRPDEEIDQIMSDQAAKLERGEKGDLYKTNSLGRLQKVTQEQEGEVSVSGQIATKDLGPWSPNYLKLWNRRANEWNAMKAGNQIRSFVAKAEAEQTREGGRLNVDEYMDSVSTYVDQVVKNTDMKAAGAVRLSVDKDIREAYQRIWNARDKKDMELYLTEHKEVQTNLANAIYKGIKDNGSEDEAMPLLVTGYWQHMNRKFQKLNYSETEIAKEFDNFRKQFNVSAEVNTLNKMFGDAKTQADVEAIAARNLKKIRSAKTNDIVVPTLQLDTQTGAVSVVNAPFSELYPSPDEQEKVLKSYQTLIKSEMELSTQVNNLELDAFERTYTGLLKEMRIASDSNQPDIAMQKQKELFAMLSDQDDATYNAAVLKGLKLLTREQNFGFTQQSRQLAILQNAEWNELIPELKKYLGVNDLKQFEVFFPINGEAWQEMQKGLSPETAATGNKARLTKIFEFLYGSRQKNKGLDEYSNALRQGIQLEHTEKRSKYADENLNTIARAVEGLPDDETYQPFRYDPTTGKAEFLTTKKLTDQISNAGVLPFSVSNAMRTIVTSTGAREGVGGAEGFYQQKQAVLSYFRMIRDEGVYTDTNLRKALGDEVFNALVYSSKNIRLMGDFIGSTTVLDKMAEIANLPTNENVKITSGWKETAKKWPNIIEDASVRLGLFNDLPPLNNVHMSDISYIANQLADRDQTGKDQEEIAKEAIEIFKKTYKPSNWGIKGGVGQEEVWTKNPINKYYSHIKDDDLTNLLREKLSAMNLRVGSGETQFGTQINAEDIVFPGMSGKGPRIAFSPSYREAGKQIYRPYILGSLGQYIPLTDGNNLIDIDLSEENMYEQKRATAIDLIQQNIDHRQSVADGNLREVGNFFKLKSKKGFSEDVIPAEVWQGITSQVEAQEDIIALTKEKNRIENMKGRFNSDPYEMYNRNPLQMRITEIMTLAKAMETEEAENFGELSKERQFEILSKYKLQRLQKFIEAYYKKGYTVPTYETDEQDTPIDIGNLNADVLRAKAMEQAAGATDE